MLPAILIDKSSFVGSLSLSVSDNDEQQIQLNEIIIEKQDKYLKLILGEIEYLNFKNDLNVAGVPQSQEWIDFLDGTTIVVTDTNGDSKNVLYEGFKSILTGFLYYEYEMAFLSIQTNSGNVSNNTENSIRVNPSRKIASNYNNSVDYYGIDWAGKFILEFKFPYRNKYPLRYLYNTQLEQIKPTAYNYLYYTNLADDTKFADWQFSKVGNTNVYGI